MTLQELSKQVYPDTEVEIKGKVYPYIPNLQRDGFVKGYEEALKNIYTVGQLKECWNDSNDEMRKCFSSSYVPKTFEQWLNEKFKIKL
jgi:DNA-binding PadR family transcriptional regulator